MADTERLSLPLVAAGQAQKHVTVNEAFRALDALVQLRLRSITDTSPPGSPDEGDAYGVPSGATGDWDGHGGEVAFFADGEWEFRDPVVGMVAWIGDEGRIAVWTSDGWLSGVVVSDHGATTGFFIDEEEVTVSGATTDTAMSIPNRAIVFGVTTRTTVAVTGATSYDCGVSGETNKFGGTLGIALGSTNSGVIGPTAYYSATPIRLTANGSNFTGGKVRVAIHYMLCGVPAS